MVALMNKNVVAAVAVVSVSVSGYLVKKTNFSQVTEALTTVTNASTAYDLTVTTYWDCATQACDTGYQMSESGGLSYANYAPMKPSDYIASTTYGEALWMVGAANKLLQQRLMDDTASKSCDDVTGTDYSCGYTTSGANSDDTCTGGGCGKCMLITPISGSSPALVMMKNLTTNGNTNYPALDLAVPGFNCSPSSTADTCSSSLSDFLLSQAQADVNCGTSGIELDYVTASDNCSTLPSSLSGNSYLGDYKTGCQNFADWRQDDWTSGMLDSTTWQIVDCPAYFVEVVRNAYGKEGVCDAKPTCTLGDDFTDCTNTYSDESEFSGDTCCNDCAPNAESVCNENAGVYYYTGEFTETSCFAQCCENCTATDTDSDDGTGVIYDCTTPSKCYTNSSTADYAACGKSWASFCEAGGDMSQCIFNNDHTGN